MEYTILDPTGNITALIESPVSIEEQPAAARELMLHHPEVEQVGFVRFPSPEDKNGAAPGARIGLRMAGGEFCGNASMSAAALYFYRNRKKEAGTVLLDVSGTSRPVRADIVPQARPESFCGAVHMPGILSAKRTDLSFGPVHGNAVLVGMEGISHIIIERGTALFFLMREPAAAEEAAKTWCRELSLCGLGLMFLETDKDGYRLTPLVYVPGSGTVFWENSCASGTSAAGFFLSQRSGVKTDAVFNEPGGRLRVTCSPSGSDIVLYGSVRIRQE